MKPMHIILAILAAGMLTAGCTGTSEYSANISASGNAGGNAATGGAQGSGGPGDAATQPEAPATGNDSGAADADDGQSGAAGEKFSDKDYSELLNSGTASMCTVSYKDENGGAASLDMYFNGKGAMRIEQATGFSDCPLAAMVYKGDSSGNGILYVACPGHEEEALGTKFGTHEQCMWKSMKIEQEWGGIGTSSMGLEGGYSTPTVEYLDSPRYSCGQWTPDESKFNVSGFVCSFD